MRKYLFISHSSVLHGAEISLLELIRLLRKKELCQIQVVLPLPVEDKKFLNELNILGVESIIFNYKYTRWVDTELKKLVFIKQSLHLVINFLKLLFRSNPDIIVFNTVVISPMFSIVSWFFKAKKIWFIHELGVEDHGYRFFWGRNFSIRFIYALADQVVFNSFFTKGYYDVPKVSVDYKTSVYYPVINNLAIENRELKSNIKSRKIWKILVVGRTCEGKGQMDALVALNILLNKYNIRNIQMHFVGEVPNDYTKKMKEYCSNNGLDNVVSWVQFTDKSVVQSFLGDSDIAIVSSRNEAFGRITVEYMFHGLMVIGTNVGGTMEILEKFKDCTFSYTPGDTNQLVKHLYTILEMSEEELRLKAENVIKKSNTIFDEDNYYNEWNKILLKLGYD